MLTVSPTHQYQRQPHHVKKRKSKSVDTNENIFNLQLFTFEPVFLLDFEQHPWASQPCRDGQRIILGGQLQLQSQGNLPGKGQPREGFATVPTGTPGRYRPKNRSRYCRPRTAQSNHAMRYGSTTRKQKGSRQCLKLKSRLIEPCCRWHHPSSWRAR